MVEPATGRSPGTEPADVPTTGRTTRQLLRENRDFRLLFSAQVVSLGGDWFGTVALLGIVGDLSHDSGLAKSLVFVAQSLPAFAMTVWAGPVADRFDRRKVMVAASSLQAFAALALLLIGGRLWVAYGAMSLITALSAFFGPAAQASVANLVDAEDLPRAAAALGSTWGIMLAVGASLGAAFTSAFGRNASFVADALSFVIAAALIALIRRPTSAAVSGTSRRPPLRPVADTRAALGLARRDHTLLALLCSKGGFGLSAGVVGVLTVLAVTRFHGGDGATGVLLAARGIGVVFGPLLAARLGRRDVAGILRTCALSGIVFALAYGGVAWAPTLAVAAVFVAIAHLGGGAQWTLSTLGLTIATPDAFRGRIMAADFAIVTFTMSTSFLLGGVLEHTIGAGPTLLVLAAIAFVWGVAYLRVTATLRRHGQLAEPTPASTGS